MIITGSVSPSQNINMAIKEIDELVDDAKKKDAKNTTKELEDLLIEYILAEMRGDTTGTQAVSGKIAALLSHYSGDMEKANALVEKLEGPQEQTGAELDCLQSLIAVLKQDAASGEMNGF